PGEPRPLPRWAAGPPRRQRVPRRGLRALPGQRLRAGRARRGQPLRDARLRQGARRVTPGRLDVTSRPSEAQDGDMSTENQRVAFTKVALSEEEWRERLSPKEYHVLREAGTERPGTGELLHENREGVYSCRGCGAELFQIGRA